MGKNKNKGGNENENKVIDIFDAQLAAHGGDIYAWAQVKLEENNSFRGTHMNEQNMKRLENIAELGKKVCELDNRVDIKIMPPLNRTRHGMVQLICPCPVFFLPCIHSAIAKMFKLADDSSFAIAQEENRGLLLISFGVHDIWEM